MALEVNMSMKIDVLAFLRIRVFIFLGIVNGKGRNGD